VSLVLPLNAATTSLLMYRKWLITMKSSDKVVDIWPLVGLHVG